MRRQVLTDMLREKLYRKDTEQQSKVIFPSNVLLSTQKLFEECSS